MRFSNPTLLETLFWEIKSRAFFILFSFAFTFIIAYQNSKSLLYIFVLSYRSTHKNLYFNTEKQVMAKELELGSNDFSVSLKSEILDKTMFCKGFRPSPKVMDNKIGDFKEAKFEGEESLFRTLVEQTEKSQFLDESIFQSDINFTSISFIFTDVEEAFSNIVLVCLIFSLISVIPIGVYHFFSFLSPSFYFHESLSWLFRLFVIILIWCFFIYNLQNFIIPKLAEFLLLFEISSSAFSLSAETKISSYCSWVSKIWIVTNGFFFFFVSIFFTIISQKKFANKLNSALYVELKKNNWFDVRKVSAIISVLVSALLAPPEAIQIFLALFFFILFEIFIYIFTVIKYFSAKNNLLLK